MRMLSLLITLAVIAWLVMTQAGGNKPAEVTGQQQAIRKAEAAVAQVDAQTAAQAKALARLQEQAGQAAQSLEQRSAEQAP